MATCLANYRKEWLGISGPSKCDYMTAEALKQALARTLANFELRNGEFQVESSGLSEGFLERVENEDEAATFLPWTEKTLPVVLQFSD